MASPSAAPGAPAPPRWLGAARAVVDVTGMAALAAVLFGTLVLLVAAPPRHVPDAIARVLVAAGIAAEELRWLPVLALLHALTTALASRPRGGGLGLALVAALAAVPAWAQADFLTSGDAIAAHAQVGVIRAGLFVLLAGGLVALWLWHLAGVEREPVRAWLAARRASAGPRRRRVALGLWIAAGVVALAGAYVATDVLRAYAALAAFLAPVAWLIAVTFLWRATPEGRRRTRLAALGLGLAALGFVLMHVAPVALAEQRAEVLPRAPLVTAARASSDADPSLVFAFARPDAARCAELGAPAAPPPFAGRAPRHVVLVSVDALRRDAVFGEEDGRPVMPFLQAFARGGLVFERAMTTYPATVLALGGAFTGRAPSELALAARRPSSVLAELAPRFDRRLAVLPKSKWFDSRTIETLILQGTPVHRSEHTADAMGAAIDAINATAERGGSLLLWVHLFDPHAPYKWREDFDFGDSKRDRYLSEVARDDFYLRELFRALAATGVLRDSLVIFFADHGQALGERGYYGHHVYLDPWISEIPLIVWGPGVTPGQRLDPVAITDVAATLRHVYGLPPAAGDARSLLAPPEPDRAVVSEAFAVRGRELFKLLERRVKDLEDLRARARRLRRVLSYEPKLAITTAEHRLIVGLDSDFYDVHAAASGGENLAYDQPALTEALLARLRAWVRATGERVACGVEAR